MNDIGSVVTQISGATERYLEDLSQDQISRAVLQFGDEEERRRWFYTPTPRPGLYLRELSPKQHQNLMRMLAASLSEVGYNYASTVIGLERLVDYDSGFPERTYGDVEGTRVRDPDNYCVAVFGSPSDDEWSWRIGGHHLSLHVTIRDGAVSMLPAFFGAEPAHVRMPGGVLLRALAAEEDLARELLHLLSPEQRARAVLSPIAPTDIVQRNLPRIEDGSLPQIGGGGPGGQALRDKLGLTPAHDEMYRYSTAPKGLPAGDMSAEQRAALVRLARVYFEHLPEAVQHQSDPLFEPAQLDATTFAWAGPGEFGAPHYYRVQGERLLIEYDCTQNDANHTHSVVRDPLGDFGDDLLAQHYALDHSHR
ncbi:MAG TPA: DUF3500 domain-containing protein [Dehalococcoidia bacterium]|nr:DUF3500 domain-containing protein [Dehalococcoidia bacterium]